MSKKQKENSGSVTKNRAIKIFEALGFKTASKWDEARLQKKLIKLDTLIEGAELDKKTQKRVNDILRAQKGGRKVVVIDPDDAAADKKRGKEVEDSKKRVASEKAEKKGKAQRKQDKVEGKKKTPKKKEPKKPGVIATILEIIQSNPASKKQILDRLKTRFPDRPVEGMEKTISAQLPNRMAKEKGIKIKVDDKGRFSTKK